MYVKKNARRQEGARKVAKKGCKGGEETKAEISYVKEVLTGKGEEGKGILLSHGKLKTGS